MRSPAPVSPRTERRRSGSPRRSATDGSFNVYLADVYGRTEFDEDVGPGVGDRILVFGDRR